MFGGKEIYNYLKDIFSKFDRKPFLFIGSGMSRRYINLPDWKTLLISAAKRTNPDDKFFFTGIISKIKTENPYIEDHNLYPMVATEIEKSYNDKFFQDEQFELEIKKLYETEIINMTSPFKLLIAKLISENQITPCYKEEKEHFERIKNYVSGIITTNYDMFLEGIYSDFDVYITQEDLMSNILYHDSEIYKIHGSISQPSTIVITNNDYEQKKKKEKYLSSKLLTIFIEYPIIFLGFSANDSNIIRIFEDVNICLNSETRRTIFKKMLFVNYVASKSEQLYGVESIGGVSINSISLNLYNILYKAMCNNIKSGLPVKIIKRAKEMIATLVENDMENLHKNIIQVNKLEEISDESQLAIHIASNESVFEEGYKGLTLDKLMQDVVFDIHSFDPKLVMLNFAENNRARCARSKLPLYKYYAKFSDPNQVTQFTRERLITKIDDLFSTQQLKKFKNAHKYNSIEDIIEERLPFRNEISKILMSIDHFKVEDIKKYLVNTFFTSYPDLKEGNRTDYRKIVVVYDFLENK